MLIEMNGEKYNCSLVRREFNFERKIVVIDSRAKKICEEADNCATCMFNINYKLKRLPKLELQPMTETQIADLKERNTFYPITADSLMALRPKQRASK